MNSASRRGLQFVRRASFGGLMAASIFAAGEVQAQVVIPPEASGTAGETTSSFGAQSITINNGGTLNLSGMGVQTNNGLRVRFYDTEWGQGMLNPLNLINQVPEGDRQWTGNIDLQDEAAILGASMGALTAGTQYSVMWTGLMNVTENGNHFFQTRSDDGSVFWVDLNRDGTFGAGELIVNSNFDQGPTTRNATTNLSPGLYPIAIAMYENGGGEFIQAQFRRPSDGNTTRFVSPGDSNQNNLWSFIANQTENANFSANAVTVNGTGTINVDPLKAVRTTIGTLTMSSGSRLNTSGGRLTAGPLTTSGGTVTKGGASVLSLVPSTAVGNGTTIDVNQGTLEITNTTTGTTSVNGAPITLSGGTLSVNAVETEGGTPVPGWLGRFYHVPTGNNSVFEPVTGLDSIAPEATAIAPAVNFPSVGDPGHPFTSLGVTLRTNDHASRFTGRLNVTTAGNYMFSTESDDGSVMWIDLNNDGDFADAGEEIVDNRGDHGMQVRTSADVPLTVGQFTMKVEHYERGGGSGIIARYGQSGSPLAVIPQSVVTTSTTPPDYQSNITLTENSTITSSGLTPRFGDLSIAAGKTLTLSGGGARFDNVNLPAGTVTINTSASVPIGHLNDGANTGAVLTKAGTGTLILDDATNDVDGTTINVQAGTVSVKNTSTGGNPLGASTVQLSGGTLMFDTSPFALTGVNVVGSYTGRFYNLDAGSGSDASFDLLNSAIPIETVTTGITEINFPSSGGNPFESVMVNDAALTVDDHAARFQGQINVTTSQNISFFTNSDDGSILWVDLNNDGDFTDAGEEVVDNRGLHGMQVRTGSRFLAAGAYNIRTDMFERGGGSGLIAGFQGVPEFINNVNVTANSTINVGGSAGAATTGNIALNAGVTLTKTGSPLTAGNLTLAGNGTLSNSGNMTVASISDGTNSGTFTHTGPAAAPGTLTVQGAGDLSGTTVNVAAGAINAVAANSLANAPAINLTGGGGLRVGHADAVSAATPITVGRSSFVDFDAPLTSGRKITVDAFGAVVGQLDNLSYGTGPNQVSLVNNSVLGPAPGETNLPAPLPAGNRLLFGITANNQTATHGGATSTGPTDLYRGVAIGGWTDPGALAANLSGPTGGDLNVHIVAPSGQMPGNITFKNINPTGTQFNTTTGVVNMLGQGRVIVNGGGPIGGNWTIMNRTGDPNFFGANNVVLELAGSAVPNLGGGQTVNLRHGSVNLPGGAANTGVVGGTINILEGGTIVMDDGGVNAPTAGIFNVTGTAGTIIRDAFDLIIDINGDSIGDARDVSAGPGAIYTNQGDNSNVLGNGANFNVGPGFLLVIDSDNMNDEAAFQIIMPKADIIFDDQDRGDDVQASWLLGNGRRLTTTSNNNADINNSDAVLRLAADPAIVGTPGAHVILSAAEGRSLDINDRNPDFAGVTLQIGDDQPFTTTEGTGVQNTGFADLRVQRRTVSQGGLVRLAGVTADNIVVQSGVVFFEDNFAVTLGSTGNMTIEGGSVRIDDNAVHTDALTAGNWGRTGAEIRIEDGGALRVEFIQQAGVRNVAQTIRANGPGVAEMIVDGGGGSGGTNVHLQNVILGNGATLAFGVDGATMSATVNATAGNGSIQNNISDTAISVNVNAGSQPITFTGSRLTQLASPVTASAINIGSGPTRSGRLSVSNQSQLGTAPVTISPFSHLAFNPGSGSTVTPNLASLTQGSGTLRAQSGIVDFGTGIVSGATVAPTTVAGLQHSILPGAANLTEPNANVDVQLGTLAATSPNTELNVPFANLNTTHVYTGEFFDADGIVAFAEHFDDTVLLRVDGRDVLSPNAWNVPSASPDDDAATPGLQTNIGAGNAGWHTFELRVGQGGGGAGTPGNQGGANWPFGTFGVGFNPNPGTSITNATDQANYQPMLDNGSMNLFRSVITPGAGDLFVDGGATMRMGGFTNQDNLTLNGTASATATLNLVGTTGANALLHTRVNGLGAIDNPAGGTVTTGALTTTNNATLTKLGGGTLNVTGAQSHGTGTNLTVSAGTANINTDAGSATARNLTVNANSATNFGSSQHLANLNVGAGATATLTAGGPKNLVTSGLTIAGGGTPTGTLNITDNAAIVNYPTAGPNPADTIRSQIVSGRGGTDLLGTWTGLGITSSAAAADPTSLSIGFANNADLPLGAYTTFRGEAVDDTTVLIRTTRIGDANLDGVVGDDDVTIVGATFGMTSGAVWALGDFTYDGAVNDDDVTLLGALYDPSAAPVGFAAPVAAAGAVAAVPEPATWLMLTLGGLGAGLFGWRRRKV
ncbi:MAG: PA14 domain-containing protein [Pirellulales bacterium]